MVDMFPVLRVLGILIMVFALTMGLPLSVSWFLQDGVWQVYPLAMLCTLAFGFGLWSSMRLFRRELQPPWGDAGHAGVGAVAVFCGTAADDGVSPYWAAHLVHPCVF